MNVTKSIFLLLVSLCLFRVESVKVFDLRDYGAVEDGYVDSSQALLNAWNDACKWKGKSRVQISKTYLVNPITLEGPCYNQTEFSNSGILKAPVGLRGENWIEFQYIDGLALFGGGLFDGRGPPTQAQPNLPTLLRFSYVHIADVSNVKLINSQNTHFHLFGCNQITIRNILISSPGDSPNTDGIKMGASQDIKILDTTIASGDDCVAILKGSKNITVSGVTCGPGHGISIGSMGKDVNETVEHVIVQNCHLFNTSNGLRIKTWANYNPGSVTNVQYENITFNRVDNPIIIDQNYCPTKDCAEGNSRVQIRDITFRNITGTSETNTAVNFQCSQTNPCEGIELKDINITYGNNDSGTISKCENAKGNAYGQEIPKPCVS